MIKTETLTNLRAYDKYREDMKAPTYPNWGWHFTKEDVRNLLSKNWIATGTKNLILLRTLVR